MAAGGYDISLSDSKSESAGLSNPQSLTDTSINSGAGRLVTGITFSQVVMAIVASVVAALLLSKWLK